MKVADLPKIGEIDTTIQTLLNELTSLYQQREQLVHSKGTSKKTSRKQRSHYDDIELSSLDLTLRD